MHIIGEALETVNHVKYLGTSVEKERGVETGITEWDQVGEIVRKAAEYYMKEGCQRNRRGRSTKQ